MYSPENLIENSIIEVSFNTKTKLFYKLRSRPDKEVPNFIKVADDFWEDIINPIPITDLSKKKLTINNRMAEWKEYRGYSNSEKDRIIKNNIDPDSIVLDIGFGKGGDIRKYAIHGINNIIAIEPDSNNIEEFFKRYKGKYTIIDKFNNSTIINVNIDYKYSIEILLVNSYATDIDTDIINTYVEKIREGRSRPLVVTMFFSLTYFFTRYDNFVELINILMEFNPVQILGTVMDGEKAKMFINEYEWDQKECGFILRLSGNNNVYIEISDSATVLGHNEYLCDLTRFNNFLSYYNYELVEKTYFNFDKENNNLLTQFASTNCFFMFKPTTKPDIFLNRIIKNIVSYNSNLGIQLDASYFYRCLISLKNTFNFYEINYHILIDMFKNKLVYSSRIRDYYGNYGEILDPNNLDNIRYYFMTGLNSESFILTYEVQMNDTMKKNIFYNSKAPLKLTNVIYNYYFNKEENDAYQVFNILKEHISRLKNYSVIECNSGVGNYTIIFIYLFKSIICVENNLLNTELTKHNLSVYHNNLNIDMNESSFIFNNIPVKFVEKFDELEAPVKSVLFVNYQLNKYNLPSLESIKNMKNIEMIIILTDNIIPNVSDYFNNFMYYTLISSYVYIIENL